MINESTCLIKKYLETPESEAGIIEGSSEGSGSSGLCITTLYHFHQYLYIGSIGNGPEMERVRGIIDRAFLSFRNARTSSRGRNGTRGASSRLRGRNTSTSSCKKLFIFFFNQDIKYIRKVTNVILVSVTIREGKCM